MFPGQRPRLVLQLGQTLWRLTRSGATKRLDSSARHAPAGRRWRASEYGARLRAKQKLEYRYGLTERQLRKYVQQALRRSGPSGILLLQDLEQRLDNVVFRLGLAPTIHSARRLVADGHILVNGERVDGPDQPVHVAEAIRVRPDSVAQLDTADGSRKGLRLLVPTYLEQDEDGLGGRMVGLPNPSDTDLEINPSLVFEFYAR